MRRWIMRLGLGTALLGLMVYLGIYELMYDELPWQSSAGTAAQVLAQTGNHLTALSSATLAPTTIRSGGCRLAAATGSTTAHGQLLSLSFRSQLMGGERPMQIYLPPDYTATHDHYPVLYLLHGAPGQYDDWSRAAGIDKTLDAMIAVGRIPPMIAVLPDGNGGMLGDTEWANNQGGTVRAEDYVVQEIVPWVDQQYRTCADADHRIIAGLSTGGFGAVNIALHHPEMFHYVAGLSGNYLAAHTWTGKDIWGGDQQLKAYNSPLRYASKVAAIRRLHVYLTAGSFETDGTLQQTRQMAAVLQQLGVRHRLDVFPGSHTWSFWKTHIVDALDFVAQEMAAPSQSAKSA